MMVAAPGPTWMAHGTEGSFIKYGMDPQEAALKEGRTPDEPDWDVEPPEQYGTLTTPHGSRVVPTLRSSFARYYENVRDAILGKAKLAVTPEWSLDVMRGLLLAIESSRQRRVLPWPR
jgi:predicted dehydrogenase